MKVGLKEFLHKNLIFKLSVLVVLTGITAASLVMAVGRPLVVLFYTDWNALCRETKPVMESLVASYNNSVELQELNIDSDSTPDKARALGLSIPPKVPYVAVIDKKGNIVMQTPYHKRLFEDVKTQLNTLLNQ